MTSLSPLLRFPLSELILRWTVLLTMAWIASATLRLSHPRRRLLLWRNVLVLGCILPLSSPIWRFHIETVAAAESSTANKPSSAAIFNRPAPAIPTTDQFRLPSHSTVPTTRSRSRLAMGPTVLVMVWLVGAAVGAVRLLRLQRRLARLRRYARPDEATSVLAREIQVRMSVSQNVTVRVSDSATSPFICGLLQPTIVLPAELHRTANSDQISALLAHELAHLRSHDLAWCVAWRGAKTLLWFHPLMWQAPAAHNLACEQEADRVASDQWSDRSLYARWLAQLTLRVIALPPVETVLAMNGASQIVKRLILLRRSPFGNWNWRDSLSGSGLLAALALISAGWGLSTARAQTPAPDSAALLAEQQKPRTVVAVDPQQFDRYTGFYQLSPTLFFTVSRRGGHFYCALTGQRELEYYPESPTKFFTTLVAAQVSFKIDATGNATDLVLHQNGLEQAAPRVDESVVASAEKAQTARIENNLPDPDREAPLRRFVDALISGAPNYDDMSPGLSMAVRRQWPGIQKDFAGAGAFKTLTFQKITPQGADVYRATFENRVMTFLIGPLTADHKMQGLFMPQSY